VHEKVHDQFVITLLDKAKALRAGSDAEDKIGPITMPAQINVIRAHINDALARGGRALIGGPDAVGERFVQPTVLVDVPDDAKAITDETFGPTLTVAKVRDMDEAVARANATRYGLGNTVFGKKNAVAVAKRLRSGMVAINAVISFAAIPSLPFGGVGESGFGRIHGPDGLREFARAKAIARQRFPIPLVLTTFSRTENMNKLITRMMTLLHGRR
jgi:acyl-CoA reductase-like NAD-dependent aldehyde dehydrogenase